MVPLIEIFTQILPENVELKNKRTVLERSFGKVLNRPFIICENNFSFEFFIFLYNQRYLV